jgi:transcription antitermination factor NusG
MQKNWYIIYTKPKSEKKVATLLSKQKIEFFFPLNLKESTSLRKKRAFQQPLFKSYVFANTEESEIGKIKNMAGVVNLLYWKGKPAVIKKEEIEVIKDFITDYQDIRVEKIAVNIKDIAKAIDGSRYSFTGNILTVKNTVVKVNLPSIGYRLIAKLEASNPLLIAPSIEEKDLLLQ